MLEFIKALPWIEFALQINQIVYAKPDMLSLVLESDVPNFVVVGYCRHASDLPSEVRQYFKVRKYQGYLSH